MCVACYSVTLRTKENVSLSAHYICFVTLCPRCQSGARERKVGKVCRIVDCVKYKEKLVMFDVTIAEHTSREPNSGIMDGWIFLGYHGCTG